MHTHTHMHTHTKKNRQVQISRKLAGGVNKFKFLNNNKQDKRCVCAWECERVCVMRPIC